MTQLLEYLVDALSGGGIYALLTIGLALLFSVMGLMNFAYGELIMTGGFAMFLLRDLPWPLMVAGVIVAVVVIALITERLAFRPLRGASPLTLLIGSFAVSVILQNAARMTVGPRAKGVEPYDWLDKTVSLGGVDVQMLDLVTIAVALALIGGLVVLLKRTQLGVQLRAAAEDFEMAALLGVKSNRVIASAFAITGVLAAVAALMLVMKQGSVSVTIGSVPLLIAFVGAVVGGMGSLGGAALGGFLLGATTAVLDAALPGDLAPFRDAFVFGLVIVMLATRPQGLVPAPEVRV
ncbi:branched-chain amino acid ABC transporter permease [Conexibacter woesei]|uniref:Inner-membrane translocator n=1 Tax=Conexibacter woesei (strain DSM 14684 / CCUG 47730 / CIP 108061 / JCM 11494 / NBRC 100937 / ID131577) TaxID=469383 RepID=D3F9J6_CONWI|nr:branched-chain amino acid ABC transporter permease [Conexibacter woesei]ADB51058.1 inner-membrane translocator [Conexibacter woesei DSM 14684]